jgi:adenylosuccinate lyase
MHSWRSTTCSIVSAGSSKAWSSAPSDEAYRLVQRHALRAWDEEQDFRELVRADRELTGRVDLDAVFDLSAYTRHVDTVFERLRSLVRKEETVHA